MIRKNSALQHSITPLLQSCSVPMLLTAVLLAGGESRRMGRDKATVYYKGEPLWRRQLELLRRISPLEILISARTDPIWRPPDIQFVLDAAPSRGPLSGLAAAMAVMRGTHLLALAVDMPLMTDAYLRKMRELAGAAKGVLPIIHSRPEPLAAIYPRGSLSAMTSTLQTSTDFSVTGVAEKLVKAGYLRVMDVDKRNDTLFRSINSPADLLL
jgi:molybdopterin-guanine dinucleotide biosynthesis protein A